MLKVVAGEGGIGSMCASVLRLFLTTWTVAMGFSRQEYRSRLPLPTPGVLPDSEIKSVLTDGKHFRTNSFFLKKKKKKSCEVA